jgi:hypothetical protein
MKLKDTIEKMHLEIGKNLQRRKGTLKNAGIVSQYNEESLLYKSIFGLFYKNY